MAPFFNRRNPIALSVSVLLVCLATACTPLQSPNGPVSPSGAVAGPAVTTPDASAPVQEMSDTSKVEDAIQQAIQQHPAAFPKGAHPITVAVRGGVATVDFSPEFNQLANMGDSTESAAQKHLRAAMATFPSIQQMRVTVDGKAFDSQVTDWDTPFPVRPATDERDEAAGHGPPKRRSGGGR